MAISLRAAGTWADNNSTSQTVTLPTHQAGDMLIVRCGAKAGTMASLDPTCATNGWARAWVGNNGATGSGNGTGSVEVAVFWKIATSSSETNPVISWGTTATPGCAVALSYQKGGSEVWVNPTGVFAADASAASSYSATCDSHTSVTSGDYVDFFFVICDDTTMTVPSISQTGVTYAAVSEQPAAALSSTTSNDISADGGYRSATSGTSSAAAVISGTLSTSETGTGGMTRLRVQAPEEHSGSPTLTGGGSATVTGAKRGAVSATLTGGGAATASTAKRGQVSAALAGGGVATVSQSSSRTASPATTGGGAATVDQSTSRTAAPALAGGGAATVDQSTARSISVELTGGGAVTQDGQKVALVAPLMSGGGVLLIDASTVRQVSVELTGGGEVTVDGEPVIEDVREASPELTGSGSVTVDARTSRSSSPALSGGGAAQVDDATIRRISAVLAGGGSATVDDTTIRRASPALAGGGRVTASSWTLRTVSPSLTGGGVVTVSGPPPEVDPGDIADGISSPSGGSGESSAQVSTAVAAIGSASVGSSSGRGGLGVS